MVEDSTAGSGPAGGGGEGERGPAAFDGVEGFVKARGGVHAIRRLLVSNNGVSPVAVLAESQERVGLGPAGRAGRGAGAATPRLCALS